MSSLEKQPGHFKLEKVVTTHTNTSLSNGQVIVEGVPESESKRVLRRIDLVIIPLMGFCYMLQFMDKLALSQATLLGLRKDLVSLRLQSYWFPLSPLMSFRTSMEPNTPGVLPFSTSAILFGVGQVPTLSSDSQPANTSQLPYAFGAVSSCATLLATTFPA